MKVAFISIGDELLIGQTINTNAAWLGKEFSERGFSVVKTLTIKDREDAIIDAVAELGEEVQVVIITGGLGPTKDDITKKVLTEFFGTRLEIHQETLSRIESYFEKIGRPMLQSNIDQALLPVDAMILKNEMGTAAGMLFEKDNVLTVSLPGVPYEMKHLMIERVFPILEEKYSVVTSYYETVLTQGIGESFLADRMSDIEDKLRGEGLELAYLPSPGMVRLRITGEKSERGIGRVKFYVKQIEDRFPQYVFGKNEDDLSEVVGKLLRENKLTVSTVESCTGGRIAAEIVKISGASDYFNGGFVTYSNELKMRLARVESKTLMNYGAVSQQTVEQMAKGGREELGTDYAIAVSGIAGPEGGTEEKPVGTVWICIAGPNELISKRFLFGNNRSRTIEKTVLTALNLLRCMISKINFEKSS